MVRSDAVETYAPIFLGFWSLEFLEGWLGFALTFLSTVLVLLKIIQTIRDWRK